MEELFKLGQCSMSTVLFRAAKRLKMAKKDEVDFSVKASVTGTNIVKYENLSTSKKKVFNNLFFDTEPIL